MASLLLWPRRRKRLPASRLLYQRGRKEDPGVSPPLEKGAGGISFLLIRMALRAITRFLEIHRSRKYPGARYASHSLHPPALKN